MDGMDGSIWAWRYYCSDTGTSKSYKHYSTINDNMFLSLSQVFFCHACHNNSLKKEKQCCAATSHWRRQGQTLCSKYQNPVYQSQESYGKSSWSSWSSWSSSSSSCLLLICLTPHRHHQHQHLRGANTPTTPHASAGRPSSHKLQRPQPDPRSTARAIAPIVFRSRLQSRKTRKSRVCDSAQLSFAAHISLLQQEGPGRRLSRRVGKWTGGRVG